MERILKRLVLLVIVFGYAIVLGQNNTSLISVGKLSSRLQDNTIRALNIGDNASSVSFDLLKPDTTDTLSSKDTLIAISNFKDKLVLLSFWSPLSEACNSDLLLLDSLKKEFEGKLKVILVSRKESGGNREAVSGFIKRWKKENKRFSFEVAINDESANLLFPHELVPYYVWIAPGGRVAAFTSSNELTIANIQEILEEQSATLPPVKEDITGNLPGYKKDLSIGKNWSNHSFFIKGAQVGMSHLRELRRTEEEGRSVYRGLSMRNLSLLEMYETAVWLNQAYSLLHFDRKREILEVADSAKLLFNGETAEKSNWEKDNLYSCNILIPGDQDRDLYEYTLEELNRSSGYFGRVEKRKVKSWVLINSGTNMHKDANGETVSNTERGKHFLKNAPVPFLIKYIDLSTPVREPVIDGTGGSLVKVDIVLDMTNADINPIRKVLNTYGLDLVEAELELDMLVISDKKQD